MFKKALTYLLLGVLMANMMAYQCVYVYFRAHRKFVAQNLCEKKEIKNNTCKGKCHLKKMAKAATASTQKMMEELKVDVFCQEAFSYEFDRSLIIESSGHFVQQSYHVKPGYLSGVYAPPKQAPAC